MKRSQCAQCLNGYIKNNGSIQGRLNTLIKDFLSCTFGWFQKVYGRKCGKVGFKDRSGATRKTDDKNGANKNEKLACAILDKRAKTV